MEKTYVVLQSNRYGSWNDQRRIPRYSSKTGNDRLSMMERAAKRKAIKQPGVGFRVIIRTEDETVQYRFTVKD